MQKMYKDKVNNSLLNLLKEKIHKTIIDWKIYKCSKELNEIKDRKNIKVIIEKIRKYL